MTHIPVTAAYLEEFAAVADKYAKLIREWKAAVEKAIAAGLPVPTMNGLQTRYGKLVKEYEKALLLSGQATAIGAKADAAEKRGTAAQKAKRK